MIKSIHLINTKYLEYCLMCNTCLINVSNEDDADEKYFEVSNYNGTKPELGVDPRPSSLS